MKEWIFKHRNEIFVGIICSITVTIVVKAGAILALIIPRAGQSLWGAFVDYIFHEAAIQSSVSLLGNIYTITISMLCAALCGFLSGFLRGIVDVEKYKKVNTFLKTSKNCGVKTEEVIEAEKKLEKLGNKLNSVKSIKALKIRIIYLLFCCILFFLYGLTCIYYPTKLYHCYQIDIIYISPYISEQDIKILNSRWVSMKGKADYEAIYAKINQVKKENNLTRSLRK